MSQETFQQVEQIRRADWEVIKSWELEGLWEPFFCTQVAETFGRRGLSIVQLGYERQYLISISKKNLCCRRYISSKSEISIERHNHKDSSVNMIAASFLEEQPQEYLAKMLQQPE